MSRSSAAAVAARPPYPASLADPQKSFSAADRKRFHVPAKKFAAASTAFNQVDVDLSRIADATRGIRKFEKVPLAGEKSFAQRQSKIISSQPLTQLKTQSGKNQNSDARSRLFFPPLRSARNSVPLTAPESFLAATLFACRPIFCPSSMLATSPTHKVVIPFSRDSIH
jgi:hypothetical protein